MATRTKEQHAEHAQDGHAQGEQTQKRTSTGAVVTVEKDAKPLLGLFTKFNNDWSMNLAAGLAYNLLMSIFPILIALLAILGLIVRGLSPSAYANLITNIQHSFPNAQSIITTSLNAISKSSGVLGIIAIILAIFNGSRLFVFVEGCFDIIYHVRPRTFIPQNIMAVGMLLLFVILIPIMVFASILPTLVLSLLHLAKGGILVSIASIIGSLIVAWIFFEAIYVVVPNQKISFRNSWLGALVAAILMEIYLELFPLYVAHFINGGPIATIGSFIILLVFFYYFAVILFLGAEVNAYFAEGIKATPYDIPTIVHEYTSHLPTSEKTMKEEAAASHKGEQPKVILPKNEETTNVAKQVEEGKTPTVTAATNGTKAPATQVQDSSHPMPTDTDHAKQQKKQTSSASRTVAIGEAVAGTALAFVVELVRLRRKK